MHRLSVTAFFCLLPFLSGCAGGPQWEKQMVSGSNGPAYEIRMNRSNVAPAQSVPQQVVAQMDTRMKQAQLQEQLLKQAAMIPPPDFKDYKVGPEDLLQINVLNVDKLCTEARVNGQGLIRLLLIGDVQVSGLTAVEVAKKLSQLYKEGDYLVDPQITVSVKEFQYQKVAVTGAVNKPDHYALIGPRTLLEVLGMAGGLSDKAGEIVNVIRPPSGASPAQAVGMEQGALGGAQTVVVDLNQLLLKGDIGLNIRIQNGDVVFVPFARSAYVLGAVQKPGGVLIKENLTVTKAIAQTGGVERVIGSNNVTILRTDENGRRTTIPLDLNQITRGRMEDIALQENDIVFVHESGTRRFLFDIKSFFPGSVGLSPMYW